MTASSSSSSSLPAIAPRTAEDFRTKSYVGYRVRMTRGVDANGAKQMGITILTEGKRACEPFRIALHARRGIDALRS